MIGGLGLPIISRLAPPAARAQDGSWIARGEGKRGNEQERCIHFERHLRWCDQRPELASRRQSPSMMARRAGGSARPDLLAFPYRPRKVESLARRPGCPSTPETVRVATVRPATPRRQLNPGKPRHTHVGM